MDVVALSGRVRRVTLKAFLCWVAVRAHMCLRMSRTLWGELEEPDQGACRNSPTATVKMPDDFLTSVVGQMLDAGCFCGELVCCLVFFFWDILFLKWCG